jgi:hypothetical protein
MLHSLSGKNGQQQGRPPRIHWILDGRINAIDRGLVKAGKACLRQSTSGFGP